MRGRSGRAGRRTAAEGLLPALSILVLPLTALPLLGNGGTPRVVDHPVGTYRVSVYTAPTPARPDSLDVSVLVVGEDGSTPIGGLHVLVRARRVGSPEGSPAGGGGGAEPDGAPLGPAEPVALTRSATREAADDPRYYAAKFSPGRTGVWRIEVEVDGPGGSGTVAFDVRLREPGPLQSPWVVLALSLLPLLALTWWLLRTPSTGDAAGVKSDGDTPRPGAP